MAQTPALFHCADGVVDYTPGSAVLAGQVVEIGTIPMIAPVAIAGSVKGCLMANGIWKVPQKAEIISAGDAVYWDPAGDPVLGTAGTGAATGTAASLNLMGVAIATTAATDAYVYVQLTAAKRTTTIAGSVTANDITGSDSTLTVTGKAGAAGSAGGTVPVAGGAGHTNGAGGAAGITGGAGAGTGAGGAANLTGGASGSGATGNGGASSVVGGAASSTNGNGGAAAVTGGAATGTGTGGAANITSGASAGAAGSAGNVSIDCGAPAGGTAGTITIGGSNAGSITLGKMPIIPSTTVAAAGSGQGDAAAIATGFTLVTAADGAKGVILPAAAAGLVAIVKNRDSENAILKVYPGTGDAINALGANNPISMAAKTSAMFVCYDATTWYTIPLLPS